MAGGIYYFVSNPAMSDSDDVDKPSKEEIQNYIDHFDLSTLEFEKIQPSVYKYSKKLGFLMRFFHLKNLFLRTVMKKVQE